MSSQTGGMYSNGSVPTPYAYTYNGNYGGQGTSYGTGSDTYAKGDIKTVFTWYSKFGNPPPDLAVVHESCGVYVFGYTVGPPSFQCDDGLGGAEDLSGFSFPWSVYDPDSPYWLSNWARSGEIEKFHAGGPTITITRSPIAEMAGDNSGSAGVFYKAGAAVPYVSGTNCPYTFHTRDDLTGTLKSIEITCNGETVFKGASIGGGTADSPRGVVYDSTHYKDDTPLTFHTKETNTDGVVFDSEKGDNHFIVYNKYAIRCAREFEQAQDGKGKNGEEGYPYAYRMTEAAAASLKIMNHTQVGFSDDGFAAAELGNDAKVATAIHFSAHGYADGFRADISGGLYSPNNGWSNEIILTNVKARGINPPINVVFASSCSTASDDSNMVSMFFPRRAGLGIGEDHAYCGFDLDGLIAGMQHGAKVFWDYLSQGYKTDDKELADKVQDAYDAELKRVRRDPVLSQGLEEGLDAAKYVSIGDAKLHGVYGGPTSDRLAWFFIPDAVPPAGSTPPAPGSTPPAPGSTPPAPGSTPPAPGSTPPGQ